jgi:hypothetical protein
MTFEEKQELLQKMDFYDLDFSRVPEMLGEHLKQAHAKNHWSQTQVAALMGKNRSHINKAHRNTSNTPIIELTKHYIVSDLDMNMMMAAIVEDLLKAPRLLNKKSPPKK